MDRKNRPKSATDRPTSSTKDEKETSQLKRGYGRFALDLERSKSSQEEKRKQKEVSLSSATTLSTPKKPDKDITKGVHETIKTFDEKCRQRTVTQKVIDQKNPKEEGSKRYSGAIPRRTASPSTEPKSRTNILKPTTSFNKEEGSKRYSGTIPRRTASPSTESKSRTNILKPTTSFNKEEGSKRYSGTIPRRTASPSTESKSRTPTTSQRPDLKRYPVTGSVRKNLGSPSTEPKQRTIRLQSGDSQPAKKVTGSGKLVDVSKKLKIVLEPEETSAGGEKEQDTSRQTSPKFQSLPIIYEIDETTESVTEVVPSTSISPTDSEGLPEKIKISGTDEPKEDKRDEAYEPEASVSMQIDNDEKMLKRCSTVTTGFLKGQPEKTEDSPDTLKPLPLSINEEIPQQDPESTGDEDKVVYNDICTKVQEKLDLFLNRQEEAMRPKDMKTVETQTEVPYPEIVMVEKNTVGTQYLETDVAEKEDKGKKSSKFSPKSSQIFRPTRGRKL